MVDRHTHEDSVNVGDNGTVAVGAGGDVTLSSNGTDGSIDNADGGLLAIGLGATDKVLLGDYVTSGDTFTTEGVGAIVAGKCSVTERGDGIMHETVVEFSLVGANDLDLADGADHGTGIKIYDFPAGDILILGATCNALVTSVNAEGGGATFPMALGSEVAGDEATLTGTEADIIPSTAIDGGATKDFHASLAASILLQNAGGADLDLYVNAAITDAVSTGAVTIAVTGTAKITWLNLGDY